MAPNPCPRCASGSIERSESADPSLRWAASGVAFVAAWWTISELTYRREGALVMAALFLWPVARAWRRSSASQRRPAASSSYRCLTCGHPWRQQPSPAAKLASVVTTGLLMLWLGFVAVVRWPARAIGRTLKLLGTAAVVVAAVSDDGDGEPRGAFDGRRDDASPRGPSADDIAAWSYAAQQEQERAQNEEAQRRSGGARGLDKPKPGAATNLGEYKPGRWGNLG